MRHPRSRAAKVARKAPRRRHIIEPVIITPEPTSTVIHIQPLGRSAGALPERRCGVSGKRCFPTEAAALAQAEEWSTHNHFREAHVYRCPACPGWHLSSRPAREAS